MAQLRTAGLVYPAMRTFTEHCLSNDLSLLWPTEPVRTLETLARVKGRFVVEAIFGDDRRFVEKLRLQFDPLRDQCWRLFADALFVYSLPSLFLKNKYAFIRDFVGVRGLPYRQRTIRGSFSRRGSVALPASLHPARRECDV